MDNAENTEISETPEEQDLRYGRDLAARLMGARITAFGTSACGRGQIILSAEGDEKTTIVISTDDDGFLTVTEPSQEG